MTAKPGQVLGFDYITGKPVAMTPAEWRDKYQSHRRVAEGGETAYYLPGSSQRASRVAEAYAIIPAGKVTR